MQVSLQLRRGGPRGGCLQEAGTPAVPSSAQRMPRIEVPQGWSQGGWASALSPRHPSIPCPPTHSLPRPPHLSTELPWEPLTQWGSGGGTAPLTGGEPEAWG